MNLFTNATTENSHPASLEMKPNPLARTECSDLQNCTLSFSFPQLPTNKMLPKSPPPLQSHFNDCVYGSCHDGPEATFNTQLRCSEPGSRLQSKPHSQVCTWPSSDVPCTRGPRGRQPVSLSFGGSLGTAWVECSQGGTDSRPCRFPCLLEPCLQAAFPREVSGETLIK